MGKHSKQIVSFDLIRGSSALLVCAHHLRAGMIVDFAEAKSASLPLKAFYFLMSLGHEAVIVFFVLSGFFIGGTIIDKIDRFSPRQYAIARLSRLWTALLPALILTFVSDRLLGTWNPEVLHGQYQEIWGTGPGLAGGSRTDLMCFMGNLAFLQTVLVPCYGTNSALWSLANEFWYYVLFPVLVFSCAGQRRGASFCVFCLIGWWLPVPMLLSGLVWLLGVLLYFAHRRGISGVLPLWAIIPASMIFASSLVAVKHPVLGGLPPFLRDLICGAGFSVFALTTLSWEGRIRSIRRIAGFSSFLSKISYSLYLTHVPVLLLLLVFGLNATQMQMDLRGLGIYCGFLFVIVASGWGFWYLFERRTDFVRTWLLKHLSYRNDPVRLPD